MAAIDQHPLELSTADPWSEVVSVTVEWARAQGLSCRDLIVVLPFAQLLPVARRAFGAMGGWMPRVETTQSLARSLGPGSRPAPGQLSFDVALDHIVADRLLRAQSWAAAWAQSDVRGFAQAVAEVVQSAHALASAAFALPPDQRTEHWARGRALLSLQSVAAGMPGARERLLGRVALEWAASTSAPATDALFELRPAGWIVLQAGGPDLLTQGLLQHAAQATPCLWLDTDVDPADPFATLPPETSINIAVCEDFEAEAQRSAACVLRHLQDGEQPVALIAQDRVLVRRVRALLARQGVGMRDETGWKLSTTRAGASVRGLLNCVRDDVSTDDWLDWLKACTGGHPGHGPSMPGMPEALDELEVALRARKVRFARTVDPAQLAPRAAALWRSAQSALRPLYAAGHAVGSGWLSALEAALRASGQRATLESDDAGRQVLAALQLTPAAAQHGAAAATEPLDLDGFSAWVDTVLEQASFLPESSDHAWVVITPLARAMLRPFAAVVFPGADERHLGAAPTSKGLLSDSESSALGLPGRQARRDAEIRAFAQVLRLPRLSLLYRANDEGEPRAPSPWVELLGLALRRLRPDAWSIAPDARVPLALAATPLERPQPRAPALLPRSLSASACEALRACPYRFFALRLLRLSAVDELDADLEKREYGTWLHAVLQRFHTERAEPLAADVESARLHEIALAMLNEQHLDEAEFLPYSASFARLAPRYIAWLHQRDSAGAKWLDAERSLVAQPPEWGAVEMRGVIDRVDFIDEQGVPTTQLIDYKTGQAQTLHDAIRRGEDTQLPFYAALVAAQGEGPGDLSAMYLMLDEGDKIREIPHADVHVSALELVEGMGRDLARLRAGAAMPALGEGRACEFCDARGLCRRDHWPSSAELA